MSRIITYEVLFSNVVQILFIYLHSTNIILLLYVHKEFYLLNLQIKKKMIDTEKSVQWKIRVNVNNVGSGILL